jgi:hypothetical protein
MRLKPLSCAETSNGGYSLLNHAAKAKLAQGRNKPIQHQDLYSSLEGLHAKQVVFSSILSISLLY